MTDYLIPDLFRLVLEYSAYYDRRVWNYPEDTGLIYEHVRLTSTNLTDLKRMTAIEISSMVPLPNIVLLCLKTLSMSYYFNTKLILLCPNLKTLKLGYDYNQPLDLSSVDLICLQMGTKYNQPLDISSQLNLQEFVIGDEYDKPLTVSRQTKLTKLRIGDKFTYPLNIIPMQLTDLYIGDSYTAPLELSHQRNINTLYIGNDYNFPLKLHISAYTKMKKLTLNSTSCDTIHNFVNLIHLILPNYTKRLDLTHHIHLRTLTLDQSFNNELILPSISNLGYLHLGSQFNQPLDISRQYNLTCLYIGSSEFSHELNLSNCTKLERLMLCNYLYPLCLQTNIELYLLCINDETHITYNHPIDIPYTTAKVFEIDIHTSCPIYVLPINNIYPYTSRTVRMLMCRI